MTLAPAGPSHLAWGVDLVEAVAASVIPAQVLRCPVMGGIGEALADRFAAIEVVRQEMTVA